MILDDLETLLKDPRMLDRSARLKRDYLIGIKQTLPNYPCSEDERALSLLLSVKEFLKQKKLSFKWIIDVWFEGK